LDDTVSFLLDYRSVVAASVLFSVYLDEWRYIWIERVRGDLYLLVCRIDHPSCSDRLLLEMIQDLTPDCRLVVYLLSEGNILYRSRRTAAHFCIYSYLLSGQGCYNSERESSEAMGPFYLPH